MDSPEWLLYIAIVVLLLLSAFFSSSETALSTLNKIRMQTKAEKGNARAKNALRLAEDYDKTLTTILIGNNIVNITGSTIAAVLFTSLLGKYGPAVSTAVMTLLVLVFGEILPKSYSMAHSDQMALRVARPLRAVSVVLTPLSFVFLRLNRLFSKPVDEGELPPTMTEAELHTFIEHIEEQGVLEEQESELVQSALEFDDITVREIITPRVEMVALDVNSTDEEIHQILLTQRFSRIPVYENNVDTIIGFIYSRDLLQRYLLGLEVNLRDMLSPVYFAHKSMKLSQLLQNLKAEKANLAVVTDDYGGTLGLVTMRDVLQELVGELWEEGSPNQPDDLTQLGEDRWEASGALDLEELFEELGLEEQEGDDDFITVNGWASAQLQHLPEPGEEFRYEGYTFRVEAMDGRRIHRLLIARAPVSLRSTGAAAAGD